MLWYVLPTLEDCPVLLKTPYISSQQSHYMRKKYIYGMFYQELEAAQSFIIFHTACLLCPGIFIIHEQHLNFKRE